MSEPTLGDQVVQQPQRTNPQVQVQPMMGQPGDFIQPGFFKRHKKKFIWAGIGAAATVAAAAGIFLLVRGDGETVVELVEEGASLLG